MGIREKLRNSKTPREAKPVERPIDVLTGEEVPEAKPEPVNPFKVVGGWSEPPALSEAEAVAAYAAALGTIQRPVPVNCPAYHGS